MIVHLFNSGIVSGPEKLVLPALKSLEREAGAPVYVIFLEEQRLGENATRATAYAQALGLRVKSIEVCGRVDIEASKRLAQLLDELAPAVIHAHDVKATSYGLLARYFSDHSFPVVSTHHGVKGRPDLRSRGYEYFYRYCLLPFCDQVFAVSREDAETLRRWPFLRGKIFLHLNGIAAPSSSLQRDRRQALAAWGERENILSIGWVGRLSPEKRPELMIEIADRLRCLSQLKRIPWKILLFGEGELRESLERKIRELGLQTRVALKGFHPDIALQYRGFDVVVNTSKNEGLSIALLEAAFAERALCITMTGGAKDLVPAKSFGTTVSTRASAQQFALELAPLLTSESLRVQLGKGVARRAVSRFTEERWVRELCEAYETFFLLRIPSSLPCLDGQYRCLEKRHWPSKMNEGNELLMT